MRIENAMFLLIKEEMDLKAKSSKLINQVFNLNKSRVLKDLQ